MKLKKIRDERLKEIEDKYGRGLRNEIDHILSSYTKFFLLVLEKWKLDDTSGIEEIRKRRIEALEFLKDHFDLFLKGYEISLELVKENNSNI